MTQLIQMRSRIKAINTIAKITHAMQLIAMADHIRLRERKSNFERYQHAIGDLLRQLTMMRKKTEQDEHYLATSKKAEKVLLIIIGSQKGLCGSFNSNVLYEVGKMLSTETYEQADLVIIGKKVKDYFKPFRQNLPFQTRIVAEYNDFVWANMGTIGKSILAQALDPELGYTKVVLYGNRPEGFFSQRIIATQLFPIVPVTELTTMVAELSPDESALDLRALAAEQKEGVMQDPEVIFVAVEQLYLLSTVEFVLLQSLLAEQASRFVSMDAATRNTKKLRETMQIQFNKLRQGKITKELTELASNV